MTILQGRLIRPRPRARSRGPSALTATPIIRSDAKVGPCARANLSSKLSLAMGYTRLLVFWLTNQALYGSLCMDQSASRHPKQDLPFCRTSPPTVGPTRVEPPTSGLFLDSSPLTLSPKKGVEFLHPAGVEPLQPCQPRALIVRGRPFSLSPSRKRTTNRVRFPQKEVSSACATT